MKKKQFLFPRASLDQAHNHPGAYLWIRLLIRLNTGNCTNHKPVSIDSEVLDGLRTTCHGPHLVLPSEAFNGTLEEVELRLGLAYLNIAFIQMLWDIPDRIDGSIDGERIDQSFICQTLLIWHIRTTR